MHSDAKHILMLESQVTSMATEVRMVKVDNGNLRVRLTKAEGDVRSFAQKLAVAEDMCEQVKVRGESTLRGVTNHGIALTTRLEKVTESLTEETRINKRLQAVVDNVSGAHHMWKAQKVQKMSTSWLKWKAKGGVDFADVPTALVGTYDDKEEIKALGAVYNPTARSFNVPAKTNLRPFAPWLQ